jgi:adenylate cyclase
MQYTAIGDTVNVAARLMNQAAGGTIVVSETFTKAVKHSDAFEHLGEVQLKGRDQKVSVYSVIWK